MNAPGGDTGIKAAWRRAGRKDIGAYAGFLRERESSCPALSDQTWSRKGGSLRYPLQGRLFIHRAAGGGGGIDGALFARRRGTVWCILPRSSEDDGRLPALFRHATGSGAAILACGAEPDIERLEAALGTGRPEDSRRYLMMRWRAGAGRPAEGRGKPNLTGLSGLAVRDAAAADFVALCDLQRRYLAEEVMPGPGAAAPPGRAEVASMVGALLERRTPKVALLNGMIVGKANLNASGVGCDQIGGVFVMPASRGMGIATAMMESLIRDAEVEGRELALYARPENLPAIAVYRRLGFSDSGWYRADTIRMPEGQDA